MTKYEVIFKVSYLKNMLKQYRQEVYDAEVLLKAYEDMLDKMEKLENEQ